MKSTFFWDLIKELEELSNAIFFSDGASKHIVNNNKYKPDKLKSKIVNLLYTHKTLSYIITNYVSIVLVFVPNFL